MPGNQTILLRQALNNWRLIDDHRLGVPGLPEAIVNHPWDWWKRSGFPQFAIEYWCLADFVLSFCEASQDPSLQQSTDVNESEVSRVLNRYDESDMGQVHNLVTMFSDMNLEA
jgi:hypothetical protein